MPIASTRLEKLQLTKLLQSVRSAERETIEKLIVNGIPDLVNYIDAESFGDSALSLAAQTNADDIVGQLLSLGADAGVVDLAGRTAQMKAAEYGHWQSLEKLANAGANMNLTDSEGKGAIALNILVRHSQLLTERLVSPETHHTDGIAEDGTPGPDEAWGSPDKTWVTACHILTFCRI